MSKIIQIEEDKVLLGTEDNKIVEVPIEQLNFDDPKIGDKVRTFEGEDTVIVTREEPGSKNEQNLQITTNVQTSSQTGQYAPNERRCNKHVFVWIGNFLFGYLGVDRFIRGQIGLGILKLLTIGALGVWALIDFIISLVMAYGSAFGRQEDVVFINGKYAA